MFLILATAGDADLVFAAVPDVEQTSIDLEICALRLRNVGDGLPCMQHKNAITITHLSKSSIDRFSIKDTDPIPLTKDMKRQL